jgi:hypothetical protein
MWQKTGMTCGWVKGQPRLAPFRSRFSPANHLSSEKMFVTKKKGVKMFASKK